MSLASTPTDTGMVHGPTAIPYEPWGGGDPAGRFPHHPGQYGRYILVNLTENNRHIYRNVPDLDLGWGVCRPGFGLQVFGDGHMSYAVARARAVALQQGRDPLSIPNIDREDS